jgi:hypothetical protein
MKTFDEIDELTDSPDSDEHRHHHHKHQVYRRITPTDTDRFIEVAKDIEVDATSFVITTEEDVLAEFDIRQFNRDFAIYCELPKTAFFDLKHMNWEYDVVLDPFDRVGPHAVDAGAGNVGIVRKSAAKYFLDRLDGTSRFVHYRQCASFFKYSFEVGDAFSIRLRGEGSYCDEHAHAQGQGGQREQEQEHEARLFAVFLSADTGKPLPYQVTVRATEHEHGAFDMPPAGEDGERKVFFYADAPFDTSGVSWDKRSRLARVPLSGDVICPPDSEFIEEGPLVRSSHSMSTARYTKCNFRNYNTCARRCLFMYYIVQPTEGQAYRGEKLFVAFRSANVVPVSDGEQQFTFECKAPQENVLHHLGDLDRKSAHGCPGQTTAVSCVRLLLPTSHFVAEDQLPNPYEKEERNERQRQGRDPEEIEFGYESPNELRNRCGAGRPNLGKRLLQVMSEYMFEGHTQVELERFPFVSSEARMLVHKVVDGIAECLQESSDVRDQFIHQLVIRHGRRYFDEASVLYDPEHRHGQMTDVLGKLDQMFVLFTVSIRVDARDRAGNRVDRFVIRQVPVVFRLYQD